MVKGKKGNVSKKSDQHVSDDQASQSPVPILQDPSPPSGQSTDPEAPENWIWNATQLGGEGFLADAYAIENVFDCSVQKPWIRREDPTTPELFKNLLDAIALLFARYKPPSREVKKTANMRTPFEWDHVSQHVSAAVIRMLNENKQYTIYTAKNAGPRVLTQLVTQLRISDATGDADIPGVLQQWFNSKASKER